MNMGNYVSDAGEPRKPCDDDGWGKGPGWTLDDVKRFQDYQKEYRARMKKRGEE